MDQGSQEVLKPIEVLAPSAKEKTFGALTTSVLASPALDGAAGAAVGWVVAPSNAKVGYALGGGIATGLFGWLGLVGTLAWRYAIDKRKA